MINRNMLIVIALAFLMGGCAENIDESTTTVFDAISNPPPPGKRVMQARFAQIQDSVFTPSCALSGCHAGTQPPNLSVGVAYANIVNRPALGTVLDLVTPGNADNSYLFRKITGDNIVGSRMPLSGFPLSIAKIDSIRKWINDGAKNN